MRNETAWRAQIQRDLAALQNQFGALPMSPARFLDTELLFTVIADHFPDADPYDAWTLLTGHRFPARERLAQSTRTALAIARLRLPAIFGRGQWLERVQLYCSAPTALRLYAIHDELHDKNRDTVDMEAQTSTRAVTDRGRDGVARARLARVETAYDLGRLDAMRDALAHPPTWRRRDPRYADPGRYKFHVRRDVHEVEIPRRIEAADAALYAKAGADLHSAAPTSSRAALRVSMNDLLRTAAWMEEQAPKKSAAERPWRRLLGEVRLRIPDAGGGRDVREDEEIAIDGLLHLVGMVGSGKSVLLTTLAVHCARLGLRVTLVHGDVATLMRDLAIFDALRFADPEALHAVPFVGRSTRASHLGRLHRAEAIRWGPSLTRSHPGYGFLSTICPLDGLRDASKPLPLGGEPCTALFAQETDPDDEVEDGAESSVSAAAEGGSGEGSATPATGVDSPVGSARPRVSSPLEDPEFADLSRAFDCPFLPVCPQHASTQQMGEARIWLATPASLLSSGTRQPLIPEARRLIEMVLCESDVVLVDEADLMQTQFDDRFSPMEVLIGRANSWLDRLARQVSTQIYNAGRPLVGRVRDLDRWLTAHTNTQRAADSMYAWLRTEPDLRAWLGSDFFTGERLLHRIAAEFEVVAPAAEVEAWRAEAQRFAEDPLGTASATASWRQAAFLNLVRNEQARAREVLLTWFAETMPAVAGVAAQDIDAGWRPASATRPCNADWYADRLLVALIVGVLDHELQILIDEWPSAARYLDVDQGDGGLFHMLPDDLVRLVPESPMGAILGFQYYDPNNSGDGELRFFRLRGIGRALLYHLHDALTDSDGIAGPHTILASGTSWAPGSWRYHLQAPPSLVLLPDRRDDTAHTVCSFDPQVDPNGAGMLRVSGITKPEDRLRNLKEIVRSLAAPRPFGQQKSLFDDELEALEEHRRRILLVVGSYEEAEAVGEALSLMRDDAERQDVLTLAPDAAGEGELTWRPPKGRLPRSLLEQLSAQPARFLVAPLRAIERGYNILTDAPTADEEIVGEDVRNGDAPARVAAIGSVYFLVRPMPVPGDLHELVQHVNAWALDTTAAIPAGHDLVASTRALRREASAKFRALMRHRAGYSPLSESTPRRAMGGTDAGREDEFALSANGSAPASEHEALLWTQFVLVWQCIGRLLRGGVAARVHFVDAKWAPESAIGGADDAGTSMLLGFRAILDRALRHPDPAQRVVAEALYRSAASCFAAINGVHERAKGAQDAD